MTTLSRRMLLASAAALVAAPARAQNGPDFYPIPVELLGGIDNLQGRITLGNRHGDVHLVEFFDYNCGYCRRSAQDFRPLLAANFELKYTLVNYAVLGIPSVEATKVALAFSRQKGQNYLEFHQAMLAQRGSVGADIAIAIALKLGANRAQLLKDADSDAVTQAMFAALKLGEQFAFRATPSYLVGRDAVSGFLDRAAKQAAITAFQRCERVVCG